MYFKYRNIFSLKTENRKLKTELRIGSILEVKNFIPFMYKENISTLF